MDASSLMLTVVAIFLIIVFWPKSVKARRMYRTQHKKPVPRRRGSRKYKTKPNQRRTLKESTIIKNRGTKHFAKANDTGWMAKASASVNQSTDTSNDNGGNND